MSGVFSTTICPRRILLRYVTVFYLQQIDLIET
jgi:hypothetical protein